MRMANFLARVNAREGLPGLPKTPSTNRHTSVTVRQIVASPYLQFGGPLVVAGVGELLRERGVSLGVFLIAIGLVIFALAGLEQLRLRLTFRRGPLGFDIYIRWRADSP